MILSVHRNINGSVGIVWEVEEDGGFSTDMVTLPGVSDARYWLENRIWKSFSDMRAGRLAEGEYDVLFKNHKKALNILNGDA